MSKGASALFNGVLGSGLSLVVWRLTHSELAWAVLFAPAALLTMWGLYRVFIQDDA